ncbi:zinc finger CCCH domain-containing protein 5 isoform X1 [Medicago truncatula]|uniref:zinc finger CCCH domain-containing protein 5 isoform X1 n=1 Tax=Medicago truncatula TaxID=3880 RepID=UPI000D2F479C|nr:zinc finger CCCH domain-containing protein 5 isoform X1 [Medicago truncatula]
MWSNRKEKRKALKKLKRKERRKEIAEKERLEEEARLNDPEEERKRILLEQQEAERIERDRIAFEEREKAWIIKQQQQRDLEEEQQQLSQRDLEQHESELEEEEEEDVDDDDDGRPEIIWLGNEIIIQKKNPNPLLLLHNHNHHHHHHHHQEQHEHHDNRPTSNPFPPESPSQPLHNVAQQPPNFGTELDKAHCPFHLKTAACRFGDRCSRVHFYPDKSCTLLIKNMYNGPGLAWEQDEGLEYTDEEVERCFEEFYEDVHTEFLKFGEIVNFKVCKNGSFHLRGNVYVQYKLLDSALLAYNSVNGRYFAGKQVSCKFVNLTRWKVAICGEYMKSGYKTCSHGTACNFIHCFRNPGGDYEWADSDKPPPKFWVKEMVALFGHSDNCEMSRVHGNFSALKHSSNILETDSDRYHSRRSRSREMGQLYGGRSSRRRQEDERKQRTLDEEWNTNYKDNHKRKYRNKTSDSDSDKEGLEEVDRKKYHEHTRKSSFNWNKDDNSRRHEEYSDVDRVTINRDNEKPHDRKGRNSQKSNRDSRDWIYEAGCDEDRDGDGRKHHISRRKGSRHQSRDNSNVTDESESDKDRGHEEYSDVDWDTMSRENEKQHGSNGRNSQKWNRDSRYRIYEAGSDEDRHRKRHHSSQRKGSRHRSRDNSNVADESESDKDRGHEKYSDVDWDTMSRDNEKQHDSKGKNSQKRNGDSKYQIDEAGSDEDRHRKKHLSSQMKESRHQSSDSGYGIDESDKDKGEMEAQHGYSRKSSRHKRSGLQY